MVTCHSPVKGVQASCQRRNAFTGTVNTTVSIRVNRPLNSNQKLLLINFKLLRDYSSRTRLVWNPKRQKMKIHWELDSFEEFICLKAYNHEGRYSYLCKLELGYDIFSRSCFVEYSNLKVSVEHGLRIHGPVMITLLL